MNEYCTHQSGYPNAKLIDKDGEANSFECTVCSEKWREASERYLTSIEDENNYQSFER